MIFALALALFVFYFLPTLASFSIDFSLQLSSRRRRRRRNRRIVDDGSESLTQQSSLAPEATLAPPWLTHTSATFVNGQNFCLPQDEFVYFSLVFALLLSAFCIRFELFFVNVIIIFPVENVFL